MYYTGYDCRTMEQVYVPVNPHEKAMQRALIQYRNPKNHDLVAEALKIAGRTDLIGFDKKCLIRPRSSYGQGQGAQGSRPGRTAAGQMNQPGRTAKGQGKQPGRTAAGQMNQPGRTAKGQGKQPGQAAAGRPKKTIRNVHKKKGS